MHLALDVFYGPDWTRGACVGFESRDAETPAFTLVEQFAGAAGEYEPGEFKKRELPYLEQLIETARARSTVETILVDGYVWLDGGKPGLGGALFEKVSLPIIGVAKTRFRGAAAIEVLRGQSHSPLYVTTAGLPPEA